MVFGLFYGVDLLDIHISSRYRVDEVIDKVLTYFLKKVKLYLRVSVHMESKVECRIKCFSAKSHHKSSPC